jgi:hypothetical protein
MPTSEPEMYLIKILNRYIEGMAPRPVSVERGESELRDNLLRSVCTVNSIHIV